MTKTSVLFIMPEMSGGGAEKLLVDTLRRFDYDRYEVTLLLEYCDGELLHDVPGQVQVRYCFRRNGTARQRLHRLLMRLHLWWPYVMRCRSRWIRRRGGGPYDAIVSFMEGAPVQLHAMLFDRAAKHLSWVHIDLLRKHWSKQYFASDADEARAYGRMDRVVFVSDTVEQAFRQLFPQVDVPMNVLNNPVDCAEINRLAAFGRPGKTRFTICMAGRLNPQKRYDRALEVAALLKQDGRGFVLRILGDGSEEQRLRTLAQQLGVTGCVEFMGFVRPPYPYMADADVFLNTSEAEGYPLTLCEALCLGLPVVATDISGARDILGDSEFGIVTPEEVPAISEALRQLMDQTELCAHYAAQARRRSEMFAVKPFMETLYSWLS
ncbi:MAG: glycosyltransferase [Bacteroidales bacterium]|nr:glycosyltransferase [Bacteroidales bacterium]